MNCLTQMMPVGSAIRRGTILNRLFVIGYLTTITVAMFGWVSAFGWITIRLAKWLMA
jgi:hypothetical protein